MRTETAKCEESIEYRQNSPRMIDLLRARKRTYFKVKFVQGFYFFFSFALPIISLWIASRFPDQKSNVALIAFAVGMLDIAVIDRWRKRRMKVAALLQEEFDCEVLDISWNGFTAGSKITREELSELSQPKLSDKSEAKLRNWYPQSIQNLPLHVARLVCQRTNLWYDSNLRETYRAALGFSLAIYFLALIVVFRNILLSDFLLVVLVPFGPYLTWTVREMYRQTDTMNIVARLLKDIEASLEAFAEAEDNPSARARARELQDAIFAHRTTSPLISSIIYWSQRKRLEPMMNAGAKAFIRRAERSLEVSA